MFYCKTYFRYFLFLFILRKYNTTTVKKSHDIKERFLGDLDDKDWHISHLRDFELKEKCYDETFAEKAERYRKSLRNDGALVEFVSSHIIPFNPYDDGKEKCKVNTSKTDKSLDNSTNIRYNEDEIKSATVSSQAVLKDQDEVVKNKIQRRSEYQFSSVEYYDEIQDFDKSTCPEDVDVIVMEMDQLRNYLVECEAMVEWRSLQ